MLASHTSDHTLRRQLMVTPQALAALERQAEREAMTLGEFVGSLLEKAASDVLIEESIRSIEQGRLGEEDYSDKGFARVRVLIGAERDPSTVWEDCGCDASSLHGVIPSSRSVATGSGTSE